jgi:hypothetical protein
MESTEMRSDRRIEGINSTASGQQAFGRPGQEMCVRDPADLGI